MKIPARIMLVIFLSLISAAFCEELTKTDVLTLGKSAILKLEFKSKLPVYKTINAGEFLQIDFMDGEFDGEKTYPVYKNNLKLYRIIPLPEEKLLRVKVVLFKSVEPVIEENGSALTIKIGDSEVYGPVKTAEKEAVDGEAVAGKYYLRALELMKVKEWDRALQYLEDAKAKAPDNSRIVEAYNICQTKLNKFQGMQTEFTDAQKYYASAEYEKTLQILEVMVNKYPDFLEARELLMKTYFKTRNYEFAVREGNKILELNPVYDNKEEILDLLRKSEDYQKLKWGVSRLTFTCNEEPIEDVLYALSKETGMRFNYLGDKDLRISLSLQDATLDDLIASLFKKNHLEYEIKEGIVNIRKAVLPNDLVNGLKLFLPLGNTLKALAELLNINVILNPEIDMEKSVNLNISNANIGKDELFDLILKNNDLVKVAYNQNTFFIAPKSIAKQYNYQDRHFRVFKFANIEPEEFLGIIKSMSELNQRLDFSNIVVADLDENSNIIATTPTMVYKTKYSKDDLELVTSIKEKLEKLNPTNQQAVKKKAAETETTAIEEVAAKEEQKAEQKKTEDLIRLEGEQQNISKRVNPSIPNQDSVISSSNTVNPYTRDFKNFNSQGAELNKTVLPSRKVKALLVYESEENLKLLEKLVQDFDLKRPQVMIVVKIIDVNTSVNQKLGLLPTFDGETNKIQMKKLGNMSRIQLDATLDFLESKQYLKTLSNPTIRALDGAVGVVQSGKSRTAKHAELKQVLESEPVGGGNTQSFQQNQRWVNMWVYETIQSGIEMKIVPIVHENSEVTLGINLTQTDKGANGSEDDIRAYLAYPGELVVSKPDVLETRKYNTDIRMKDGETIILGGLISENQTDSDLGTPIMNRMPIIGRLFNHNQSDKSRVEMVILITPYIVNKDFDDKLEKIKQADLTDRSYAEYMEQLKKKLR
ncbi:MAG: hypothetical protein PHW04_04910 [Candidatus Wallbacteria bacterium]|nr:hypothetical protein [Candidatus Wallbacteria bacterium]